MEHCCMEVGHLDTGAGAFRAVIWRDSMHLWMPDFGAQDATFG